MTVQTWRPHARKRARRALANAAFLLLTATVNSGFSLLPANGRDVPSGNRWTFADAADLFADAPIVMRARILEATALKESNTNSSGSGHFRFLVSAEVTSLIRGPQDFPPRISYLVDVPATAKGKAPRIRRADVLIAAFAVPDRPGEIRLAARDAQVLWSAPLEARVRSIVAASLAKDAPPRVTGITGAFHVPGTVHGEGESQLFLSTDNHQPVSLSVLRRPDIAPQWALALGEIVDEAAETPKPDTLGWYRLACFLPPALPDGATGELAAIDAQAARADYAYVVEQLGPCIRTRGTVAKAG